MSVRILGLDLAVKSGFAVLDCSPEGVKVLESGAQILEGIGTAERMVGLRSLIDRLHENHDFEIVAAEAPNMMPGQSMEGRRMAFGLSCTAELWCLENSQQLKLVATTSLKSTAAKILGEKMLPKGKGQALRAASQYTSKVITQDDEADAICCALWAAGQLGAEVGRP